MALVPPGVRALRGYRRRWLVKDLVAGVVLTTLLVPQGMAYAELAGLPPITGLYTTIMCLLGYAVFGPSRILVLGPDSSLGPMIAATILPLVAAGGDPDRAVALASMLALMTAVVMIAAGVAGLGFVADLLSKPTMIGYMNGLALTILVGQLPKLFGFSVDAEGLIGEFVGFLQGLAQGDVVPAAAAVGIGGIVVILVLQRWLPKVPGVLVMVVLAIVVSAVFALGERGVSLIGVLPKGFPPLTVPSVGWSDLGPLVAGALAISLVSLADTISTASVVRRAHRPGGARQPGDDRHRRGQPRRRPVPGVPGEHQRVPHRGGRAGGRPLAADRGHRRRADHRDDRVPAGPVQGPAAVRAGGGGDHRRRCRWRTCRRTARLWHQRKVEFSLSIVAFLGVALLGVLPGIAIAVGLSILNVFRRAWRPYQTTLGLVDGLAGYHDVRSYPDARLLPGLVIYRFDAPLFFANAKTFRDEVTALARTEPAPRWILVAAEPITDVDTTAADILFELDHMLDERGQTLVFAELKDPVRRKIERYGLAREIEPEHFFPTVEAAVEAFRARTGASWTTGIADPAAATALPQPRPGQPGTASEQRGGTRPT